MTRAMDMRLIYDFFDASNLRRWNDHLRPADLNELDKQAHKMVIAWVIAKYEGEGVNWKELIERAMFSFIRRTILTDLKPELFHRIVREREKEMIEFVLREFDNGLPGIDKGLRERFEIYLKMNGVSREDRIIEAAHYLATAWEFELVYKANPTMFKIDKTKKKIDRQIWKYGDITGVKNLMFAKDTPDFTDLCGQLRFQRRWARVPRIPETNVLGHMLLVANMIYLHDLDMGTCDEEIYKNYFTALFHDLPEVLTKDVITPIKTSIDGLDDLLSEYEKEMISDEVLPLLPKEWHGEFLSLVGGPGKEEIKVCDQLAAYIEAYVSERYGMSSGPLFRGKKELREKLLSSDTSIDVKTLIMELERIDI
jgi:putative hydrolase of HD superfamily